VVNPNNDYNELLIAFKADATDGRDPMYDALKLKGNPYLAFYSKINQTAYAIQGLPPLTADRIVPLGLETGVTGTHVISLKAIEQIDTSVSVYLVDAKLNQTVNLRQQNSYTFTMTAQDDPNRFELRFTPPVQITVTDASCAGNDGMIDLYQPGAKVWDYDLFDGQNTVIATGSGFNSTLSFSNLAAGIYNLILTDNDGYQLSYEIGVGGPQPVVAGFQAPATATVNHPVTFTDTSQGALHYTWNFGDNSFVDSMQHPTHVYSQAGIYAVQLIASNAACADTVTGQLEVQGIATGIVAGHREDGPLQIAARQGNLHVWLPAMESKVRQLRVFNLAGQNVFSTMPGAQHDKTLSIRLPRLPVGSYLLQLQLSDGSALNGKFFLKN